MWLALKILAAIVVYGTAIEPRIVQQVHERAEIPNLPAAWEGKQIAVFADLQVGMWWGNTDAIRRAVRATVKAQPQAVLIAGDFVYEGDQKVNALLDEVLATLKPIRDAGIPIYAVLGNHDYSLMNEHSEQLNYVARNVTRALAGAGVHMMDNRSAVLRLRASPTDSAHAIGAGSDTLYVVGIGEKWAQNDLPERALANVPAGAARIVFMHDPDSFVKIAAREAPFAVAAHTHGMQLGIPYVSNYLWQHVYSDSGANVAGWAHDFGSPGNRLYVNKGLGFSIVPVRINAVPELTIFTLERAAVAPRETQQQARDSLQSPDPLVPPDYP
jgi:predicted MPP superfamily phosphohydrolase